VGESGGEAVARGKKKPAIWIVGREMNESKENTRIHESRKYTNTRINKLIIICMSIFGMYSSCRAKLK
jgi:hypothetical protein